MKLLALAGREACFIGGSLRARDEHVIELAGSEKRKRGCLVDAIERRLHMRSGEHEGLRVRDLIKNMRVEMHDAGIAREKEIAVLARRRVIPEAEIVVLGRARV